MLSRKPTGIQMWPIFFSATLQYVNVVEMYDIGLVNAI